MKMMVRILAASLALLPTVAMAAPDFSGTWVRDRAQSDPSPYPFYWLARPVPGAQGGNQEMVIEVRQSGGTMQVTSTARPQRSYVLDGRPHAGVTDTGLQRTDVTASLGNDALTVVTAQPVGGMPGNAPAKISETWRLSPDGKTLTISTVRDAPAKQLTVKEVYTRR